MPITFPANPTLNQAYTFNGVTWTFKGNGWSKGITTTVSVTANIPATANDGSLWLDTESADLYMRFSNTWAIVTGIGPQGATGAAGAAGTAGAAGATGATGAGATGATGIGSTGATGVTPSLQTETVTVLTGSTGTVAHNYNTGGLWVHTSIAANFTANFTNVPTTDNRVHNFTLLLYQGATPYYPNAVQIDGAAVSILWFDGNTPTPTANKTEIASFSLARVASAWRVLGSYGMYG